LNRHPNWSKGWGVEGCEISPIPLTLPLASNTIRVIASFGYGRNLVEEGKMFIKDEAKVASRVGGVK